MKDVKDNKEEVIKEEPKTVMGIVESNAKLNIREKSSLDSDVLTTVDNGDELQILSKRIIKGFHKVCTASGIEGYAMAKYIKLEGE